MSLENSSPTLPSRLYSLRASLRARKSDEEPTQKDLAFDMDKGLNGEGPVR